MPLTGLDDATDAIAEVFRDRRDARSVARRALTSCRAAWEEPLRKIHVASTPPGSCICQECFRIWPCPTIRALGDFHKPQGKPKPTGYAAWGEALREGWAGFSGVLLGEDDDG